MNYDENEIINTLFASYKNNNNLQIIYNELLEIIYNIIINHSNSFEPYLDIINDNGGIYTVIHLFTTKYKHTDILKIDIYNRLQFYELLAFIALFDKIYNKIINNIHNDICNIIENIKL